jgi:hypothetical protein|nr:MAG TPA: hypothetical protein [Caudoviricetes sp.]
MKYEKDCKYHFVITCKFKMYGMRGCEMELEDGTRLSYMPVPSDVRLSFAGITRFYKSDEGQKIIKEKLAKEYDI